ncbi:alpha/beta fold hydrolase [Leifsonia shinshuensis]|uniref:alpha/beta hydrolase family protein n=1 Tax=Leifsonia shinshuensis TaxID=150026 RepID=UPI002865DB27|nr:alpha/beta fold hydrolase [Leifsonia shinshuensis]MDR6970798.1 alpha-beta hydrolase superfamily lysophospholipase [Leifsonia shinshuensis]
MAESGTRSAFGKALGTAAFVGAGLVLGTAALGAVVTTRVARTVITPVRRRPQNQTIRSFDEDAGTVTLRATPDASMPGRFGLWWGGDTAFAKVGGLIERGDGSVTRELEGVEFGELRAGRARISGYYYLQPEELGLPVMSAEIPTDLGQAPAWIFPAPDDADPGRWVIQVHGWGASRQEGLRAVRVFHESGFTCLLASYRNDGDAPESEDRRYGLGGTEWRDIEAAIGYAVEHGARSIVLMGWSMGGAVVLQTITRGKGLEHVTGIVLESPVIDWIDTLEYQGNMLRIPDVMTRAALRLIEAEWSGPITGQGAPIDLRSMDFVARASELSLPMLILHSDDDGFVPSTGSRALAEARSDIVTLVPFDTALHTKLWNYDEAKWTSAIAGWLAEHVPAATAPAAAAPAATRE